VFARGRGNKILVIFYRKKEAETELFGIKRTVNHAAAR